MCSSRFVFVSSRIFLLFQFQDGVLEKKLISNVVSWQGRLGVLTQNRLCFSKLGDDEMLDDIPLHEICNVFIEVCMCVYIYVCMHTYDMKICMYTCMRYICMRNEIRCLMKFCCMTFAML